MAMILGYCAMSDLDQVSGRLIAAMGENTNLIEDYYYVWMDLYGKFLTI